MFSIFMPAGFFRYTFMPEILSRANALAFRGFVYIPYFLALVYQLVRLLPSTHPYLQPRNIGRYGIRHVIAEAANNLTPNIRNIDQIILFGIIMVGVVIFFAQILTVLAFLFFQPVMAMPTNWSQFFVVNPVNPARRQDLAFIMLDMVFGVPHPSLASTGFFESCVGTNVSCLSLNNAPLAPFTETGGINVPGTNEQTLSPLTVGAHTAFPFPYHLGLHRLLAIYSTGLLVVAVAIASYFVITVLAETAQSGTPFGRRFNKTWAPLRIVMAFGLLMPLSIGLNSSQYIVLYAAKYGSAFATNGWRLFNDTLTTSYLGEIDSLVSRPSMPEVGSFTQYAYLAKICEYAYEENYAREFADKNPGSTMSVAAREALIQPWVILEQSSVPNAVQLIQAPYEHLTTGLDALLATYDRPPPIIEVVLGRRSETEFSKERGFVKPICGRVTLQLTDTRIPQQTGTYPNGAQWGVGRMQNTYLQIMIEAFRNVSCGMCPYMMFIGRGTPPTTNTANRRHVEFVLRKLGLTEGTYAGTYSANATRLTQEYKSEVNAELYAYLNALLDSAVTRQRNYFAAQLASTGPWTGAASPAYSKGWAAAGMWYNHISELNGSMTMSVHGMPVVESYPAVMEIVAQKNVEANAQVPFHERFRPEIRGLDDPSKYLDGAFNAKLASMLYEAYKEWDSTSGLNTQSKPTGNVIVDAITMLLGTNGLYDLRHNPDTHPLAMLSGIGRSLVEAAIRNLGYAAVSGGGGIILGDLLGKFAGKLGGTAASMLISIATMQVTIGFVLFYVVPFLPFIYFFFAVGGWIKGIFEAMVGAPLWALAHIRIDGNGLPGQAALNGYFLIFEVFLRPILIVFGMLASVATFSSLVYVLNSVFSLVVENAAGYDVDANLGAGAASSIGYMRGRIDQFFFTVIYAIIVYMMAMASFKLIDMIPNNILRWMGQSVATFGDQREDAAQGLVSRASIGAQQTASKIGGGLGQLARMAGG